jgi:hypothetical protein
MLTEKENRNQNCEDRFQIKRSGQRGNPRKAEKHQDGTKDATEPDHGAKQWRV